MSAGKGLIAYRAVRTSDSHQTHGFYPNTA